MTYYIFKLSTKTLFTFYQELIEDLRYKELDKKQTYAEYAAKVDSLDFENFRGGIFCNASLNS
tara:strand:+ start:524 stop:712 length:189 start_codon:yes stop_codon:yes gene_type:complete